MQTVHWAEDLKTDPLREQMYDDGEVDIPRTNIFVRAKNMYGNYHSVDISTLDKSSLLAWLRSRGGNNPWAENTVGVLLGHGNLHEAES